MCQSCLASASPMDFEYVDAPRAQSWHQPYSHPYFSSQQASAPQQEAFDHPQLVSAPQRPFPPPQTSNIQDAFAFLPFKQPSAGAYPIGQVPPTQNSIFGPQFNHPSYQDQAGACSSHNSFGTFQFQAPYSSHSPMAHPGEDFDRSAYQADDQVYEHQFTVHDNVNTSRRIQ